jgi:hypothetical protein
MSLEYEPEMSMAALPHPRHFKERYTVKLEEFHRLEAIDFV